MLVAPLAGAWIEIRSKITYGDAYLVAPLAGAWIEILLCSRVSTCIWSLPSRERGLKFENTLVYPRIVESLPSRERGLKYQV